MTILNSLFARDNEAATIIFDNFESCGVIFIGDGRSQLPVSTISNWLNRLKTRKPLFSDYDLSLVCISKCELLVAFRNVFWNAIEHGPYAGTVITL